MTHVPCLLCGADDAAVLFESRAPAAFDARATTDVYGSFGRVVRCRRCGFCYRNPRDEAPAVLAAYAASEDEGYLSESECRSINAYLSLMAIKRRVRGGRLLEVGCSSGFFLNAARLDFQVEGLEPSAWAADLARRKLSLPVQQAALEAADLPPSSYDVAVMLDVVEHVPDPRAALLRLRDCLKPGALLYLVTPDIKSLSARLLGRYWWGLRAAHLSYFSRATLTRLLDETGFDVAEARSYGRLFTYGYWLSRLRTYPSAVRGAARLAIDGFGVREKPLYLNTRDSLEICAVRRA